jgi:hypothetical protein
MQRSGCPVVGPATARALVPSHGATLTCFMRSSHPDVCAVQSSSMASRWTWILVLVLAVANLWGVRGQVDGVVSDPSPRLENRIEVASPKV